jgi:nicotinate-nucleotide adenylyltransferase
VKRIGLFGGTFDPVHIGHLLVAKAAHEELTLDRLYFIPAAQSPFKPGSNPAPAAGRLRMLRLALAGHSEYEVDSQEIERGGISYSIDTIRAYARRFPNAQLFYLIGTDHLATLPKWRDADTLAQLAEFIVIPRPGEAPMPAPPPFRVRHLKGWPLQVSSSVIRERVQAGLTVDHLLPFGVSEILRAENWYRQG